MMGVANPIHADDRWDMSAVSREAPSCVMLSSSLCTRKGHKTHTPWARSFALSSIGTCVA